jgi:hypothetical protein
LPDLTAVNRRPLRLLVGGLLFAGAAIALFAWQTTGAYVRQNFRPLAGESDIALRECTAVATCARDAVSTVHNQQSLLHQATVLVYWSAWGTTLAAALVVMAGTVLVFRQRQQASARLLGIAWRAQIAVAAVLLIAHGSLLAHGADMLSGTPDAATMFTFAKAFGAPFTDVGHLYYAAWFVSINAVMAFFMRASSRTLPLT